MSGHGAAAHPSAPVMARLRVRYAKRGPARFSSHRDIARAMEWALRRAGVPVALSHGYHPHPRLSWIGAAPTGAASEAEYLEIGVTTVLDPATVAAEVDRVLPPGLGIVEMVAVGLDGERGVLADRMEASRWRLELPGVEPTALERAVAALLAVSTLEVERMTKNGPRAIDVRAALVELGLGAPGPDFRADSATCGTLTAVVRHTTPAVRPDDVLSALRTVAGLTVPVPARATRLTQGRLDERGDVLDPLAADRPGFDRTGGREQHDVADRTVRRDGDPIGSGAPPGRPDR